MNEQYERIIDMLCLTGKMPLNMVETVCNYARKSINDSIKQANENAKEKRNELIFGDIQSFKREYRSAWFDYENVYADNFCG